MQPALVAHQSVLSLFEKILEVRGLTGRLRDDFLNPDYEKRHNPFLLPDMLPAVERLIEARKNQEKITIYGDYDIDGLTATAVLVDAFASFGFENVSTYIPNRFIEGYGLTIDAVEKIAASGAKLIITVDCGSLSTSEIERAGELGVDVIVTDHHNVLEVQPPAVAVINPKRLLMDHPEKYDNYCLKSDVTEKLYPFLDLPGVGVAFKLVQALQTRLDGLESGQEKWLLDLVALGTVCDVVTLQDENRMHVYWGLKVLAKTRRPGLKALMVIAGVETDKITARSLGFALGPRMNASGRLETAEYAQKLLLTNDKTEAFELAAKLDEMNRKRRADQDKIFEEALEQAERFADNSVLVLSSPEWNHGIIGIVAAKILEKFGKPTFVLQEMGEESKGSARSYGDFSAAEAIKAASEVITKGGGHELAAGVTLPTSNITEFRKIINQFYVDSGLNLKKQQMKLFTEADVDARITDLSIELVEQIDTLSPFGNGNLKPVLRLKNVTVERVRIMGSDNQHIKLTVADESYNVCDFVAFNAPEHFFVRAGQIVSIWVEAEINEWRNQRKVEGRILRLDIK